MVPRPSSPPLPLNLISLSGLCSGTTGAYLFFEGPYSSILLVEEEKPWRQVDESAPMSGGSDNGGYSIRLSGIAD